MSFASIPLITFDCYGTLIDWENGMLAAMRPMFSRDGHRVPDVQLLELYGEIEVELEAGIHVCLAPPGAGPDRTRNWPPERRKYFSRRGPRVCGFTYKLEAV